MERDNLKLWIDWLDVALEQMDRDSVEAEFIEETKNEMVKEL